MLLRGASLVIGVLVGLLYFWLRATAAISQTTSGCASLHVQNMAILYQLHARDALPEIDNLHMQQPSIRPGSESPPSCAASRAHKHRSASGLTSRLCMHQVPGIVLPGPGLRTTTWLNHLTMTALVPTAMLLSGLRFGGRTEAFLAAVQEMANQSSGSSVDAMARAAARAVRSMQMLGKTAAVLKVKLRRAHSSFSSRL